MFPLTTFEKLKDSTACTGRKNIKNNKEAQGNVTHKYSHTNTKQLKNIKQTKQTLRRRNKKQDKKSESCC